MIEVVIEGVQAVTGLGGSAQAARGLPRLGGSSARWLWGVPSACAFWMRVLARSLLVETAGRATGRYSCVPRGRKRGTHFLPPPAAVSPFLDDLDVRSSSA